MRGPFMGAASTDEVYLSMTNEELAQACDEKAEISERTLSQRSASFDPAYTSVQMDVALYRKLVERLRQCNDK